MPTLKPRLSITLEDADLAVLDRYAAASGTPRATLLADLVHAIVPELERAAELIEMANAAPRHVIQGAVDNLANATADAMGFLQPFQPAFHAAMDALSDKLQQRELQLHGGKRRGGARAGTGTRQGDGAGPGAAGGKDGPQDPHLLTGGSKS